MRPLGAIARPLLRLSHVCRTLRDVWGLVCGDVPACLAETRLSSTHHARRASISILIRTQSLRRQTPPEPSRAHQITTMANALTENPFASTHSLDANPFDDPSDPTPTHSSFPGSEPHADRLEELNRRERELQAREQDLNKKADHIRTHGRNNFPPFFPLIFHSIADEIPEASRPLMTRIFQLWLLLLLTLIVNLVACIFILIGGSSDGGRDVGASAMYLPVIGILSFLTWYRPIYNAYMKEQSLYYYFFFFFCAWHLLFSVYAIIGVPSTGLAGLINTIQMYSRGAIVAGILGTIASAGWILQGVGIGFYYRQIWAHHSAAGHSVAQARTELAQHGAKAYFTRG